MYLLFAGIIYDLNKPKVFKTVMKSVQVDLTCLGITVLGMEHDWTDGIKECCMESRLYT